MHRKKNVQRRWAKAEKLLFGKKGVDGIDAAKMVMAEKSRKPTTHSFLSNDLYWSVIQKTPEQAMSIYWTEMLARCHFAAVSALARNLAWLDGVCVAVEHSMYLPMCTNLRSLMESSADSWATLRRVPGTLESQFSRILSALNSTSREILMCEELEDCLIHFSHARKPNRDDKSSVPKSHIAEEPWKYLKKWGDSGAGEVQELYGFLCQLTHPARESVFIFADQERDASSHHVIAPKALDDIHIRKFVKQYDEMLLMILKTAVSPSIVVLKALNKFPIKQFHTKCVEQVNV